MFLAWSWSLLLFVCLLLGYSVLAVSGESEDGGEIN